MVEELFQGHKRIQARAWFVGERIDVRAFEQGAALALSPLTVRAGERGCAVLFRSGAVVVFDLEPAEQAAFLHHLEPFVQGAFDEPETETAEISVEPQRDERVDASGVVQLHDLALGRLQVVANVLAKSTVLAHHEENVAEVFNQIEPLAESLRGGGRRVAGGRELLRQIGEVMLTESHPVGRFEVTEKPEITWDRRDLDRLYERLVIEYELTERDHALSRKLELISRTASTVLELIHTRRALRVEWYIVILIAVEIVLIVYDIFR